MSHFYGSIKGTRGEATRCGDKKSGYRATIAGWQGAIYVALYHNPTVDQDFFSVRLVPWGNSRGDAFHLASGPLDTGVVTDGGIIRLHPELVRRYSEAEAFRIMTGGG